MVTAVAVFVTFSSLFAQAPTEPVPAPESEVATPTTPTEADGPVALEEKGAKPEGKKKKKGKTKKKAKRHGKKRGHDRADEAAGDHGKQGRDKARGQQGGN
jgi:hypothetical protein